MKSSMRYLKPEPIAAAIRKLNKAASGHYGKDCLLHAALAQRAIKELAGFQTRIVIGFAGWRVGNGDSDVILHAPVPGMVYQGENGIPFHAWLQSGDYLLDFTTYQLRDKAAQLDELDGGKTQVDWCPDYLVVKTKKISTLKQVMQLRAGLFYYMHDAKMEQHVLANERTPFLDEEDWCTFLTIYQNPDVIVVGPNQTESRNHE